MGRAKIRPRGLERFTSKLIELFWQIEIRLKMLKLSATATYQAVNKRRQPACLTPVCEKHCILFPFITWTSKHHHKSADSQWRTFEKADFRTNFWPLILDFLKEICQTASSQSTCKRKWRHERGQKQNSQGWTDKIKPLMLSALHVSNC